MVRSSELETVVAYSTAELDFPVTVRFIKRQKRQHDGERVVEHRKLRLIVLQNHNLALTFLIQ